MRKSYFIGIWKRISIPDMHMGIDAEGIEKAVRFPICI